MNSYDRYLGRLQEQLDDRYIMDAASKRLKYQQAEFDKQGEDLQQRLGKRGMPAATMAEISEKQTQSWLQHSGGVFAEAESRDIARKKGIQGKIENVEFQKEEYEARKKAEKKAREKQKSSFLWRSLGTAVGAGISSAAGLGPMVGAKVGGGIAGTVVGLDDSYQTPELIEQGIGETLGGIVQGAGLIEDQKYANFLGETTKNIMNMPDKERQMTIFQMQNDQRSMSFKDFEAKWGWLLGTEA